MWRLMPMAARCRMRAADGLPVALAAVLLNLLPIQPRLPERSARLG
jgi:hypothetical protein